MLVSYRELIVKSVHSQPMIHFVQQFHFEYASIWKVLQKLPSLPFLWNIVPFSPHKPSFQLSNRSPSRVEITLSPTVLQTIVTSFEFSKLIAVGRRAAQQLDQLDFQHAYVRYPSRGGAKIFHAQISNLFSLE